MNSHIYSGITALWLTSIGNTSEKNTQAADICVTVGTKLQGLCTLTVKISSGVWCQNVENNAD